MISGHTITLKFVRNVYISGRSETMQLSRVALIIMIKNPCHVVSRYPFRDWQRMRIEN